LPLFRIIPEIQPVMKKPTIRIIHHMARTGGTVICKCLASMDEVILLSEIHPLGIKKFNPVDQAVQWFQLFSEQEMKNIFTESLTFNEIIRLINERSEQLGKKLVLRDWSHLDFTAVPFLPKASYRLLLFETLAADFDIIRIATTRHPIDQWLSLNRLAVMSGKITLQQYLHGYLRFAENAKQIGFIRYEDFTRRPDETLRQITGSLDISFDAGYKDKWLHCANITGDTGNRQQEIKPKERPPLKRNFLKKFEKNNDYRAALDILGYEHYS
jgi:hypothetical protein